MWGPGENFYPVLGIPGTRQLTAASSTLHVSRYRGVARWLDKGFPPPGITKQTIDVYSVYPGTRPKKSPCTRVPKMDFQNGPNLIHT